MNISLANCSTKDDFCCIEFYSKLQVGHVTTVHIEVLVFNKYIVTYTKVTVCF